jgi:hypothetical protein
MRNAKLKLERAGLLSPGIFIGEKSICKNAL